MWRTRLQASYTVVVRRRLRKKKKMSPVGMMNYRRRVHSATDRFSESSMETGKFVIHLFRLVLKRAIVS